MKTFATILSVILCIAMMSGPVWGQKTWTGGGDGTSWDQGSNWSGGTAPISTDNVLLDNSTVAGSYTVNLPTGAVTVAINRLTITPDAGNTITLILPSGNTASIGFNVGDVTASTDDIILNDGAVLKNSSGAASGNGIQVNSTSNGTARINTGGRYIHNTLRSTAGIVPRLSTVSGTETGIFEYDSPGTGSVAISASGQTYGSLTLTRTAGAATYTASGGSALTIRGNFLINTGVTFSSTMIGATNLAGNLTNNGAFTPGTGGVTMNGTSSQTMSGNAITFTNLTINNSNGVSISANETVNTTLTLTSGNITTGSNKMIIAAGGSVSRTNGHIVGDLQKNFSTGSNVSRTFEVGAGSDYTPVDVVIAAVTTAGNLTATSTSGDHPNIGASTLNAIKSVNRNWTLRSIDVLAFSTYNATFNFVTGDLDASVNTNNLDVGKYDGATWTYPIVGTRAATSTQATGLSSFSDFQLAESCTIVNGWTVQHIIDNDDIVLGITQGGNGAAAAPRDNRALALSPDEQYLYLGYNNTSSKRVVRKINISASAADPAQNNAAGVVVAQLQLTSGAPPAKSIAVDDVGRVYLALGTQISIYDANLSTNQLNITGFTACEGVAVARESGTLFLYATDRSTKMLKRYQLTESGGSVTAAALAGLDGDGIITLSGANSSPRGLDIQINGVIWVADHGCNKVCRFNPNGTSAGNTSGITKAMDVSIDETRSEVYVSQYTARTIKVLNLSGTLLRTVTPTYSSMQLTATASDALSGLEATSCQRLFVANENGNSLTSGSPLDSPFSDIGDNKVVRDDDNDAVILATGSALGKISAPILEATDFVILASELVQINGEVEIYGRLHGRVELTPAAKLVQPDSFCTPVAARLEMPRCIFTTAGENHTVASGKMLTLEPNAYGEIIVDDNATLHLSGGEYFMRTLRVGKNAKLIIDNGDGFVNIGVVDDLHFAAHAEVVITGLPQHIDEVMFRTLQNTRVEIGRGASIQGTLIAENGEIHFAPDSKFKGAAISKRVTIDGNVLLVHHSTAENSTVANESATSDQQPVTSYELAQNYPNPFNPNTVINFVLPEAGKVTLRIFNETGQLVRTLASGNFATGHHQVHWDGRNEWGQTVAAGVYLYQIVVTGENGAAVFKESKRMALVK